MAILRQIAQLGHPILRRHAQRIEAFDTVELAGIVADMLATLRESNGVGLAAPQIYESRSIVVIASRPNARYPYAPLMEPLVMLNPEFAPRGAEMHKDWEGCLSIPGVRALVPRYKCIKVSYHDLQGQPQICMLDDFPAKIFQHEYDHLQGLVFLDRVENNRDIVTEKEYLRLVQT